MSRDSAAPRGLGCFGFSEHVSLPGRQPVWDLLADGTRSVPATLADGTRSVPATLATAHGVCLLPWRTAHGVCLLPWRPHTECAGYGSWVGTNSSALPKKGWATLGWFCVADIPTPA
jgi:hypothetical protein